MKLIDIAAICITVVALGAGAYVLKSERSAPKESSKEYRSMDNRWQDHATAVAKVCGQTANPWACAFANKIVI